MAIGLSDKAGRKVLLIISGMGMGTANVFMLLSQHGLFDSPSGFGSTLVTLASLSAYFVCFTLGFGGMPFVILGEIFPPKNKGSAVSVCVTLIWLMNFLSTKSYFWALGWFGYSGFYSVFAGFAFLSSIFVAIFLPETKGKTLAEIQHSFLEHQYCSWQ